MSVPQSDQVQLLPLPEVPTAALALDQRGAKSAIQYFEYLALHYREIPFDYKKLNDTLREEDVFYPTPGAIIDEALKTGAFAAAHAPLSTLREFAAAKASFQKGIKVTGGAIATARELTGFDMLTVELIDRFLTFSRGEDTADAFKDFYLRYKKTAEFYGDEFLKETGAVGFRGDQDFASRFIGFLGLRKIAHAQVPLGGLVSFQTICTCSFFGGIIVGPPVGGAFGLPPVFALYANFSPTIGHWTLGLYAPGPAVCLQIAFPVCIPDPTFQGQGFVTILGTS